VSSVAEILLGGSPCNVWPQAVFCILNSPCERRIRVQLSTRFFEEGIRQFQGTRTVFVPWAEVNEVRRERGIFEIRGRQVVRIDQDYYAEPNQVRRILADSVPDNTKGKRVLGPPVP
jgi:hypothetical protein